ncbi:MAG: hypothetical protein NZZ41_04745 [Candidatus Dojkabacteria bacterium]|nr:hypothetical protein [Candidatus Dojkabacteria bacterium]
MKPIYKTFHFNKFEFLKIKRAKTLLKIPALRSSKETVFLFRSSKKTPRKDMIARTTDPTTRIAMKVFTREIITGFLELSSTFSFFKKTRKKRRKNKVLTFLKI